MNFLKEIRAHLANYETAAEAEIHKFIDYLESKYQAPAPAVVEPAVVSMPAPADVAPTGTIDVPAGEATVTLTPAEVEEPVLEAEPVVTTCAPAQE
jgi:hypothetical protein